MGRASLSALLWVRRGLNCSGRTAGWPSPTPQSPGYSSSLPLWEWGTPHSFRVCPRAHLSPSEWFSLRPRKCWPVRIWPSPLAVLCAGNRGRLSAGCRDSPPSFPEFEPWLSWCVSTLPAYVCEDAGLSWHISHVPLKRNSGVRHVSVQDYDELLVTGRLSDSAVMG